MRLPLGTEADGGVAWEEMEQEEKEERVDYRYKLVSQCINILYVIRIMMLLVLLWVACCVEMEQEEKEGRVDYRFKLFVRYIKSHGWSIPHPPTTHQIK